MISDRAVKEFQVDQGMPLAVFNNKYARVKEDGRHESWPEVAERVYRSNLALDHRTTMGNDGRARNGVGLSLARSGVLAFSGRHLQHGDETQSGKSIEVFTNCSTAMFSFISFYLLLKGSGVGRSYDADLCRVNWDNLPHVRFVLSTDHPDYRDDIESLESARHKYDSESESVRWFTVADTAEGWVKVVEVLETAAFQGHHRDKLFVFDFSGVRCKGTPIKGQQGRPASGPIPLIEALIQVATIKGAGMRPWKQALYIDHYLAACVLVGGIRRSARIAIKSWRDKDIIEFIDLKRGGWLVTANQSVATDEEFWKEASTAGTTHGRRVFEALASASFFDGTGEPGTINVDRLTWNDSGTAGLVASNYFNPAVAEALTLHPRTLDLVEETLKVAKRKKYPVITNPCGEIVLSVWGGYCVIGDVCLANCTDRQEAFDAVKEMARFLIRVNTLPALYGYETERTNRIGVSLTGIHECAYNLFNLDWQGIIDPIAGAHFWAFIHGLSVMAEHAAKEYSEELGLNIPHTVTTIKPSGTVSKVMNCTEGAHLPAKAYYLRWVQYPRGSMELSRLAGLGYPVKDISSSYPGYMVVGFPTRTKLAEMLGPLVVTADEAPPQDQYEWLRLLEKHWLREGKGNQVSYTLKFSREISFESYMAMLLQWQSKVRCCALMPSSDTSAYAYVPEESLSKYDYEDMVKQINLLPEEGYDESRLECEANVCPV